MLLSVVILSYNRPEQIRRILNNFIGVEKNNYNIIVKDDMSPKVDEINSIFNAYKDRISVDVIFHKNNENMGYDRNLLDAFTVTDAEYVFLLSDDDYITGCEMKKLISAIYDRKQKLYFTPYTDNLMNVVNRKFDYSYKEHVSLSEFPEIIYNSILFSGLIFHRETVLQLNLDRCFLSNCIYTQVYLAVSIIYKTRSYGAIPSGILHLGGDGENYFGKNSSAKNSDVLSDRNKISSNLNYQNFLLAVIKELSLSTDPVINELFLKEYKKRLISYGLRARSYGLKIYFDFMRAYLNSKVPFFILPFIVFIFVTFLPSNFAKKINSIAKNLLRHAG